MKKVLKFFGIMLGIFIFLIVIDIVCIFLLHRPIFAISNKDDSVNRVYKGVLYDTYVCLEYSVPQIKFKGTKYSCSIGLINSGKIKEIVDTTKDIKDFACAEMLESFYEDKNYTYYFNCLKGKYVIVKYEDGYEETVEEALKNKTIIIKDLDNYNIDYIKIEKEELLKVSKLDNCDSSSNLYYSANGINVYTYCLDGINILDSGIQKDLKEYFEEKDVSIYTSMNLIIGNLIEDGIFNIDDILLFEDGGSKLYKSKDFNILMCNTIDGNKDIYIGDNSMIYKGEFCK